MDELRSQPDAERREPDEQLRRLQARVERLTEALSFAETLLVSGERDRRDLERRLQAQGRSDATHVLADRIHRRVRRLLPHGSRRGRALASGVRGALLLTERGPRALAARLAEKAGRRRRILPEEDDQYARWLSRHEPDDRRLARLRDQSRSWDYRPLISVILPVYRPRPGWLRDAIESVRAQSYENWELCIADDHSAQDHVRNVLDMMAAGEPRIRVMLRDHNGGIAAASNTALESALGEFVAFLDHDDVLRPHALHSLVAHLQEHRQAGFVYSDEDKLLAGGGRGLAFFKPDWSPDLLLSCNYLCHLSMIRRELVTRVGGFRPEFDGSQDYDLFLRVMETGCEVGHVPDVLYSWRQVEGSAALSSTAKPHAYDAARRALGEALHRRSIDGRVLATAVPGWFHIRRSIAGSPRVGVIIPTRDRADLLQRCIDSITSLSTYANYSINIVDNSSKDTATLAYLEQCGHRIISCPGNFNYSRIMNHAAGLIDCDHLIFLNNDTSVITPEWIEALLEQSQRDDVGAVGCRLLFPDGRVQHEGIAVGLDTPPRNSVGHFGLGRAIREVAAVTGACMMIGRPIFEEAGGLDEELRILYNDVDLCLRLRMQGYRTIYTPAAELCHDERSSRGAYHPVDDERYFVERWGQWQALRDPYLNPNIAGLTPFRLRLE